jgi:hypothetical protein
MQQVFVNGVGVFSEQFLKGLAAQNPVQVNPVQNVPKAPKTKSSKPAGELGRGRKMCPRCSLVLGARTGKCTNCGHVFIAKKAQSAIPAVTQTIDQNRYISLGKADLEGWVGVDGIALSDSDTGYTINSIKPFSLKKGNELKNVGQAAAYIERSRLDPQSIAALS